MNEMKGTCIKTTQRTKIVRVTETYSITEDLILHTTDTNDKSTHECPPGHPISY